MVGNEENCTLPLLYLPPNRIIINKFTILKLGSSPSQNARLSAESRDFNNGRREKFKFERSKQRKMGEPE